MESQQVGNRNYVTSEETIGSLLRTVNEEESNNSDEVSPSAMDDITVNPWLQEKCIFCGRSNLRSYDSNLLECLHSACADCVNNHLFSSGSPGISFVCPVCRIQSKSLHENPFLLECSISSTASQFPLNEDNSRLANIKCTSCHDSLIATSWCADCNDFLCDGCVQAHQRLKITKEHTIKPKEEAGVKNTAFRPTITNMKTTMCSLHPQEILSLYCESCEILTCKDCQLTAHKLHSYKFFVDIATETKNSIKSLKDEMNCKQMLLNTALKVIDDRQQQVFDRRKDLLHDITLMVVKFTDAVTNRGKHLVNKLNEICDMKIKALTEKKVALEQLSTITDHCVNFITNALSRGSDTAVLKTKKTLLNHLQVVKNMRANIPNPEIPIRIAIILEKLDETCQMISRVGLFLVDGQPFGNSLDNTQNQKIIVNQYLTNNQQEQSRQNFTTMTALSKPSPTCDNLGNNIMYNNMGRKIPPQANIQNFPNINPKPQNTSLNNHVYINATPNNVSSLPNVTFTGYQQVTSSTHPQNTGYSNLTPVRNIAKNLLKPAAGNHLSTTPTMQREVSKQNNEQIPSVVVQNTSPCSTMYQTCSLNLIPPMGNGDQLTRVKVANSGAIQLLNRDNSSNMVPQQQLQWHTPQISNLNVNKQIFSSRNIDSQMFNDESYKIILPYGRSRSSINSPTSANVSSSVSKTPPPPNQTKSLPEETQQNLDSVGRNSVNDLMATIARLDSNGIKVIQRSEVPIVDSSTGPMVVQFPQNSNSDKTPSDAQKGSDDPNEDWCAACMDGGDLVCCDNCPKVFHTKCHIPPLSATPEENESWQCMLCTNIEADDSVSSGMEERAQKYGLTKNERKILERILLELYCQYEPSMPFRELVSPENVHYYQHIKKPTSLRMIRQRLLETLNPYKSVLDFIRDVRLIFKNTYTYNEENSQIYNDAKNLEGFFDQLLDKWLPAISPEDRLGLSEVETQEKDANFPPIKKCRKPLHIY